MEVVQKEVAQDEVLSGKEDEAEQNEVLAEEFVSLCREAALTSEKEELSVRSKIVITVGVPKVLENSDTNKLREEVLRDETLTKLWDLVNRGEKGYYWEKDLLFHRITDFKKGVVNRLVLPKERRSKVLQIAHDSS